MGPQGTPSSPSLSQSDDFKIWNLASPSDDVEMDTFPPTPVNVQTTNETSNEPDVSPRTQKLLEDHQVTFIPHLRKLVICRCPLLLPRLTTLRCLFAERVANNYFFLL